MATRVKVRRGVSALGIIAASDVAADHAETKVNPGHPRLETFLASFWRSRLHGANGIEVATVCHRGLCQRGTGLNLPHYSRRCAPLSFLECPMAIFGSSGNIEIRSSQAPDRPLSLRVRSFQFFSAAF